MALGASLVLGVGHLLARRMAPAETPLELAAHAALLGIATVSSASFLLVQLSLRPLGPASIALASLALAAPFAASGGTGPRPIRRALRPDGPAAAALLLAVAAVYWLGYPHNPFTAESARFSLSGRPFRFNDVSIGAMVVRIPFTVFALEAGEALPLLAFALLLAAEGLSLGTAMGGRAGGLLLLLLLPLNFLSLINVAFFNSFYASALSAACLALALRASGAREWAGVGAVLATLWCVRPEAVLFMPALALRLLHLAPRARARSLAALLCAFSIYGFPYLLHQRLVFGRMFVHESQQWSPDAAPGSCHPLFAHRLLGRESCLQGLFQYPLADRVVRTPGYPYPSFLLLPLEVVEALGLALASLAAFGLASGAGRARATFLLAYALPCWALLGLSENWTPGKTSLVLLVMPAVGALAALGAAELLGHWDRHKAARAVAAAAALASLLAVAGLVRLPPDPRFDAYWGLLYPGLYHEDAGYVARRAYELSHPPLLPRMPSLNERGHVVPEFDWGIVCANETWCFDRLYRDVESLGAVVFLTDGPAQVPVPEDAPGPEAVPAGARPQGPPLGPGLLAGPRPP